MPSESPSRILYAKKLGHVGHQCNFGRERTRWTCMAHAESVCVEAYIENGQGTSNEDALV
jgi:hypothetical protein